MDAPSFPGTPHPMAAPHHIPLLLPPSSSSSSVASPRTACLPFTLRAHSCLTPCSKPSIDSPLRAAGLRAPWPWIWSPQHRAPSFQLPWSTLRYFSPAMASATLEVCSPSACDAALLFPPPRPLSPEAQPQFQDASLPTQGHSDLSPPNLLQDLRPERAHLLPRLGVSCRCAFGVPAWGGGGI